MSHTPKFSKKTYEMVAKVLGKANWHFTPAYRFATIFSEDNPKFDREKFLKACGEKDNA